MLDPGLLSIGGLAGQEQGNAGQARQTLANDFDEFLTLLTTQLQNQDPLDPLKSEEFTNQLVQFSQLEQQIASNESLENIRDLNEASIVNSAVSFIDKTVEYEGGNFSFDGQDNIELGYFISGDAEESSITILNADGNAVRTEDGNTAIGEHSFIWDGRDDFGNPLPPGNYEIRVGAQNADGDAVETSTLVPGKIDGIEIIDGNVFLTMRGQLIGMDSILSVQG